MASEMAERFMRTLREIEDTRKAASMAEIFTDDAEVSNLAHIKPMRGRDGAQRFWTDYLNAFDHIRSQFTRVIENGNQIVLEWKSSGRLRDGARIAYRGVSLLEMEGGRVRRFQAYYDSAIFLKPHHIE